MTAKNNKQLVKLPLEKQQGLEAWEDKIKSGEAKKEVLDMLKHGSSNMHPDSKLENLIKNIVPKVNILNQKLDKEEIDYFSNALFDYGIDNDASVFHFTDEDTRGMIINLRRELIKEYACKTYGEKALVDLAVNAYARNLNYSKRLFNSIKMNQTTALLNGFFAIMSKEIDRANRHFITALETLKRFKQPELKVNVKTTNAFISQNQQINSIKEDQKKKTV
jgi:hypothetical protein